MDEIDVIYVSVCYSHDWVLDFEKNNLNTTLHVPRSNAKKE